MQEELFSTRETAVVLHGPCMFQNWETTVLSPFFSNLRHQINLALFFSYEAREVFLEKYILGVFFSFNFLTFNPQF